MILGWNPFSYSTMANFIYYCTQRGHTCPSFYLMNNESYKNETWLAKHVALL